MTAQNDIPDDPAFPLLFSTPTPAIDPAIAALRGQRYQEGMTLRDYFAGQVLANIASFELTGDDHPDDVAEATYRIADAMLKARGQRPPTT